MKKNQKKLEKLAQNVAKNQVIDQNKQKAVKGGCTTFDLVLM